MALSLFERVMYERVDGPAVVIRGESFTRPFMLKIVQQQASLGRFLFRPMTMICDCIFESLLAPAIVLESI